MLTRCKNGNISETRKATGKVTMGRGAYMGTCQGSFQRHHPRPHTASPSARLGFAPHPKLQSLIVIITGTGKATNFKFGEKNNRVHPNKNPWKILEKRERGRIHGLSNFFLVPPIISGTCKATNFKFCMHIYRLNGKKSPLKISGKVTVGVVRDSRKFSGQPYIGRIARSSLR